MSFSISEEERTQKLRKELATARGETINRMEGFQTFFKGISPKVNEIARLDLELSYYSVAVQHISYCSPEISQIGINLNHETYIWLHIEIVQHTWPIICLGSLTHQKFKKKISSLIWPGQKTFSQAYSILLIKPLVSFMGILRVTCVGLHINFPAQSWPGSNGNGL